MLSDVIHVKQKLITNNEYQIYLNNEHEPPGSTINLMKPCTDISFRCLLQTVPFDYIYQVPFAFP